MNVTLVDSAKVKLQGNSFRIFSVNVNQSTRDPCYLFKVYRLFCKNISPADFYRHTFYQAGAAYPNTQPWQKHSFLIFYFIMVIN